VPIPRLWAVTDPARLGGDFERWCAALRALGVGALQLRAKELTDRDLHALAVRARRAFAPPGLLVVNRRFDLALAAGADGVHLPADGLPADLVRRAAPAGFLVGRSTHALAEIEAARAEGADYVFFGPVLPTPSKRDADRAHGISSLSGAAALGVPVVAIGGLDAESAPAALAAGAAGVAAIRALADLRHAARLAAAVAGGGSG
jgi:thiamine-phosphate pyrophosphorylase